MAQLRGTVKLHVNHTVTLENLHSIIDKLAVMSGCLHCGLLGIDLRLVGDPGPELGEIGKLAGVRSATLGE
jgi:hypothetical protein